ncbi:MAG: N-ethylmaleimide reductase [Nitrospira sp.]|nr:MAG: N-ethylmaleimide reductase [Nitrospira sp.]
MPTLLTPLQAGELSLPNRIVMAPLTRARAGVTHIPNDMMVTYYGQRASSGLMMTECTMVDAHACAFMGEGGIYSPAHVAGWKRVTDAVHAKGGRIVMQIWHPGRAAHSALNDGEQPVSSSAVAIRNETTQTPTGSVPYEVPRALRTEEIPRYVEMFRLAAQNAQQAGFDGVQIHSAHGYLIDNFLRDGVNTRMDAYGGSIANRARFLLEVTDAAIGVWGAGRVAVRISPLVPFNDMVDSQPDALVTYVAQELARRGIAFLEIRHSDHALPEEQAILTVARRHFQGVLMSNGSHTRTTGESTVASGAADAIVYGRPYIANPDLVERFVKQAPLNEVNYQRLYGGGPDGYSDYPSLAMH